MSKEQIIGARFKNKDALDKVTGGKGYPINAKLPRMLFGKLLRSPYAHARIINIDTSAAEALDGVKAVLIRDDVLPLKFNPIYFMPVNANGANRDFQVMSNDVRFVGQAVAAVAAISVDIAEQALELIDVEYEELPGVFTSMMQEKRAPLIFMITLLTTLPKMLCLKLEM